MHTAGYIVACVYTTESMFVQADRFFSEYFTVPYGKFGSPYLGEAQQPQEQQNPLLSVCAVFPCVQTMAWLSVLGIFKVRMDADACDCTLGRWGHCKSLH